MTDGDSNLRHRAIQYVEHWYFQREASEIHAEHPLQAVREMGLVDGSGDGMRGSEPRTGRSMPPIRDMDALARRLDHIMKHVGNVNRSWQFALEAYVKHGSVRKAADAVKVNTAMMWRQFNQGLAVVQSEMVRTGL